MTETLAAMSKCAALTPAAPPKAAPLRDVSRTHQKKTGGPREQCAFLSAER
jgi:hypothetical protein